MSRTVVPPPAIRGGVGGPGGDTVPEKLVKYVPAETLAFLLPTASAFGADREFALLVIFLVGLVGSIGYLYNRGQKEPEDKRPLTHFYVLAGIAYVCWALGASGSIAGVINLDDCGRRDDRTRLRGHLSAWTATPAHLAGHDATTRPPYPPEFRPSPHPLVPSSTPLLAGACRRRFDPRPRACRRADRVSQVRSASPQPQATAVLAYVPDGIVRDGNGGLEHEALDAVCARLAGFADSGNPVVAVVGGHRPQLNGGAIGRFAEDLFRGHSAHAVAVVIAERLRSVGQDARVFSAFGANGEDSASYDEVAIEAHLASGRIAVAVPVVGEMLFEPALAATALAARVGAHLVMHAQLPPMLDADWAFGEALTYARENEIPAVAVTSARDLSINVAFVNFRSSASTPAARPTFTAIR